MNHNIYDYDPVAAKVIGSIPLDIPQAQYSTHDQLIVLYELARRLKLYDGMAVVQRIIEAPPIQLRK
jgi:hypothetical protein